MNQSPCSKDVSRLMSVISFTSTAIAFEGDDRFFFATGFTLQASLQASKADRRYRITSEFPASCDHSRQRTIVPLGYRYKAGQSWVGQTSFCLVVEKPLRQARGQVSFPYNQTRER